MILERAIQRIGERRVVAMLLLACVLTRFAATLFYKGVQPLPVENQMVAVALAEGHGYADAFRPGSGPTAHTGPLAPLLMAAVYRLLGVATPAAEVVMALLGAASIALSFMLAERCCEALGMSRASRVAALAFLCLAPIQLNLESRDASVWEFSYVACMLFGFLLVVLRTDREGNAGLPRLAALALAAAFMEILSPAAGLASAGTLGLLLVRRTRWPMWVAIGGLTLVLYLAMTTPWMLRNERVLGAPIRSRSSFGLSLAIGFYEGQITRGDERAANVERLIAIHPHHLHSPGYALMRQAGGEVPYNRKLVAETRAWIAGHKGAAAYIAARNLKNFFFPPTWLWDRWNVVPTRARTVARSAIVWIASFAGLLTLGWMLWARRWRYAYLAITLALVAAPYVASFALLRYRYPAGVILTFLAFSGAGMAVARRTQMRTSG